MIRAGSALASACLFGALLSTTAAIGVAATGSGDSDAGIEQVDPAAATTTTPPPTEPPTTAPPETEPPTTEPPTTEPPTTAPTTTPPQDAPLVGVLVAPSTSATFTVSKDFSDGNPADVNVTLVCESGAGTVVNDDTTASESDPANFTLNGVTNDNKSCTATESPVPTGYTASNGGSCTAKVKDLGCTITNTLNATTTGSITVEKKINGRPGETQEFRFVLSGASEELLLSDGERGTWEGLQPGATYTVTEVEPTGWKVSKISCRPGSDTTNTNAATVVLGDASGDPAHLTPICTFTNEETTPTTASFIVRKDFSDNSAATVPVTLSCSSGTVVGPVTIAEASPGTFTVSGFTSTAGTTCTATEDVPAGYSASGDPPGTCSATLTVGTCTITNTLSSASFEVVKVFDPSSEASVSVSLDCGDADVGNSPQDASEEAAASFTVTGFTSADATTCTATEDVPAGYSASGDPPGSCSATLTVGTCTITNTLNGAAFTVHKDFSDDSEVSVSVSLDCQGATVGNSPQDASDEANAGGAPATFSVEGFTDPDATTCTATEDVPAGYSASGDPPGSCSATLTVGTCTITNTANQGAGSITVDKKLHPGSLSSSQEFEFTLTGPGGGTVHLSDTSDPYTWDDLDTSATYTLSEASTSGWQVKSVHCNPSSGVDEGNPATIDLSKQDNAHPTVECRFTNEVTSAAFTVEKVFAPSSADSVSVSLDCSSGEVAESPLDASESLPAEFTVDGFGDPNATTCTATEDVPAGYSASGDPPGTCSATLAVGTCTITNTMNSAEFVVVKDFDPSSDASVSVSLECSSGEVAESPLDASEGTPATFTVRFFADSETTCTATEDVPTGYSASGDPPGTCSATVAAGTCTITNTMNSAAFTVVKVFEPSSDASVSVSLECSSGEVAESPLDASESAAAKFTVERFADTETACTATEDVPAGYTASGEPPGTCSATVAAGTCTITNTLNTTTFTVQKVFSDGNDASVSVSLTCTGGAVETSPLDTSEGAAEFTVTGFDEASPGSCTATEAEPSAGYTPRDGGSCTADLGGESGGTCTIYNDLNTATFTVSKDFSDVNEDPVPISVVCSTSSGQTVGSGNLSVAEGSPKSIVASGFTNAATTTCTATETTIPPGYTASGNPEGTCSATLAAGSCTITNTLNEAMFSVSKAFADGSTGDATMHLTCTSGDVSPSSKIASPGFPASFSVTGFERGASCDATEDPVPGYSGSDGGSCSAPLEGETGGACTITNTPDVVPPVTAAFTVLKNFTDNSTARVTVRVTCTAPATVIGGATTMTEGSPANVTVAGYSTKDGTTCTATETVPSGYTADGVPAGSCSATLTVGACTITNTVNTATFTVSKSFSDGNPAAVSLNVACTSGTVSGGSTSASQSSPATVTVQRFANTNTTTCTASETPVAGYTGSGSPAGTCSAALSAGGCGITNTLIPPAPPPLGPPGPPGPPPPGPTVTPITPTVTPVNVGGRAAVRGTTSSLRRVRVAGDVVRLRGNAPPGCDPVLRVDDRLIGDVPVARDGSFDVDVQTSDLDPGRHVAVVECTNPTAPLLTKVFWVAAPLSSSNILLVALSSMTMLFGLGWVGIQTLAGAGLGSGGAGAAGKIT